LLFSCEKSVLQLQHEEQWTLLLKYAQGLIGCATFDREEMQRIYGIADPDYLSKFLALTERVYGSTCQGETQQSTQRWRRG